MAELLPCPFCGGKAKVKKHKLSTIVFTVECKVCKCQTHVQFTEEEVIDIWNTRTPKERGGEK